MAADFASPSLASYDSFSGPIRPPYLPMTFPMGHAPMQQPQVMIPFPGQAMMPSYLNGPLIHAMPGFLPGPPGFVSPPPRHQDAHRPSPSRQFSSPPHFDAQGQHPFLARSGSTSQRSSSPLSSSAGSHHRPQLSAVMPVPMTMPTPNGRQGSIAILQSPQSMRSPLIKSRIGMASPLRESVSPTSMARVKPRLELVVRLPKEGLPDALWRRLPIEAVECTEEAIQGVDARTCEVHPDEIRTGLPPSVEIYLPGYAGYVDLYEQYLNEKRGERAVNPAAAHDLLPPSLLSQQLWRLRPAEPSPTSYSAPAIDSPLPLPTPSPLNASAFPFPKPPLAASLSAIASPFVPSFASSSSARSLSGHGRKLSISAQEFQPRVKHGSTSTIDFIPPAKEMTVEQLSQGLGVPIEAISPSSEPLAVGVVHQRGVSSATEFSQASEVTSDSHRSTPGAALAQADVSGSSRTSMAASLSATLGRRPSQQPRSPDHWLKGGRDDESIISNPSDDGELLGEDSRHPSAAPNAQPPVTISLSSSEDEESDLDLDQASSPTESDESVDVATTKQHLASFRFPPLERDPTKYGTIGRSFSRGALPMRPLRDIFSGPVEPVKRVVTAPPVAGRPLPPLPARPSPVQNTFAGKTGRAPSRALPIPPVQPSDLQRRSPSAPISVSAPVAPSLLPLTAENTIEFAHRALADDDDDGASTSTSTSTTDSATREKLVDRVGEVVDVKLDRFFEEMRGWSTLKADVDTMKREAFLDTLKTELATSLREVVEPMVAKFERADPVPAIRAVLAETEHDQPSLGVVEVESAVTAALDRAASAQQAMLVAVVERLSVAKPSAASVPNSEQIEMLLVSQAAQRETLDGIRSTLANDRLLKSEEADARRIADRQALDDQLVDLKGKLEAAHVETREARNERDEARRARLSVDEAGAILEQRVEALKAELKRERDQQQVEHVALTSEVQRLKSEVGERDALATQHAAAHQQALDQLKAQLSAAEAVSAELRTQGAVMLERIAMLAGADGQASTLTQTLASTEIRANADRAQLAELQRRAADTQREVDKRAHELAEAHAAIARLEDEVERQTYRATRHRDSHDSLFSFTSDDVREAEEDAKLSTPALVRSRLLDSHSSISTLGTPEQHSRDVSFRSFTDGIAHEKVDVEVELVNGWWAQKA